MAPKSPTGRRRKSQSGASAARVRELAMLDFGLEFHLQGTGGENNKSAGLRSCARWAPDSGFLPPPPVGMPKREIIFSHCRRPVAAVYFAYPSLPAWAAGEHARFVSAPLRAPRGSPRGGCQVSSPQRDKHNGQTLARIVVCGGQVNSAANVPTGAAAAAADIDILLTIRVRSPPPRPRKPKPNQAQRASSLTKLTYSNPNSPRPPTYKFNCAAAR